MIARLLQIRLFHAYFSSGRFESCSLVPDACTTLFMAKYRLFMRSEAGTFGLYSDNCNPDVAGLVRYLNARLAGAPLRFLLTNEESQFYRVTDLPFDFVGQIFLSSAGAAPGPAEHGAPCAAAQRELAVSTGPRAVQQPGVVGVLTLYLDDWLAAGATELCYETHFQARTLHWLYYVINRSQIRLMDPVICNQTKTCFEAPVPVVLPGGERALSFSSGALAFPLMQAPVEIFNLVDKFQSSLSENAAPVEQCLITGLPTPDGENIKAHRNDGALYTFGEMYVYL